MVFADLNRNGVRDTGEPGFAGAAVVVRQAGGALTRQLTSDGTGAYVASNLPIGSYAVTVVLPAGFRLTTTAATNLAVAKGENSAPAAGVVTTLNLPLVRR